MHFEAALAANARLGARPALARTQYEYARLLVGRDAPGDRARALALRAAALELADGCGMVRLVADLTALVAPAPAEGAPGEALAPESAPVEPGARAVLRHDVDFWTIGYGRETFQLKDTKGLGFLHTLLRHPGREFHVLDLASGGDETEAGGTRVTAGACRGVARPGRSRRLQAPARGPPRCARGGTPVQRPRTRRAGRARDRVPQRRAGARRRPRRPEPRCGVGRRARPRQREPHDRRGDEEDRIRQPRLGSAPHGYRPHGLLLLLRTGSRGRRSPGISERPQNATGWARRFARPTRCVQRSPLRSWETADCRRAERRILLRSRRARRRRRRSGRSGARSAAGNGGVLSSIVRRKEIRSVTAVASLSRMFAVAARTGAPVRLRGGQEVRVGADAERLLERRRLRRRGSTARCRRCRAASAC